MSKDRGRPRQFELEPALDAALGVFWRKGFLSASLTELTEAMDLNKPSLYAAFGDKEALYLQTLQRYIESQLVGRAGQLESQGDARTAMRDFMLSLSELFTHPDNPGGCFIINGTADLGSDTLPAAVDSSLRQALQMTEGRLRARLVRAQKDRQLPSEGSPDDWSGFFMATIAGLAVLAKGGAAQSRLKKIIDAAMSVWPEDSRRSGGRRPRKA